MGRFSSATISLLEQYSYEISRGDFTDILKELKMENLEKKELNKAKASFSNWIQKRKRSSEHSRTERNTERIQIINPHNQETMPQGYLVEQSQLNNMQLQQFIRFCPGQANPRALSEHNFAFYLAKLARQDRDERRVAFQIFLKGLRHDQDKDATINDFISVTKCIKRGLAEFPNREQLFRAYCESGDININSSELTDRSKKQIIEKAIDTINESIEKLSSYDVPVVALIDSPYRKAPIAVRTSAYRNVDNFLLRNLGFTLSDIAIAVRNSDTNANPPIESRYTEGNYLSMNHRNKTAYLRKKLLDVYIRDCKILDLSVSIIPWSNVSIDGWPENVPKKISNLSIKQLDNIYDALNNGDIIFSL